MEDNTPTLETKTSNKDLWLFLIVLDVIFLCVFGFFLYKYFSARIVTPAAPVVQTAPQTEDTLPEITEEALTVTETNEVQPSVALKEEVIAVQVPEVIVEPTPVEEPKISVKKSIVVAPVANSKYRRVTFKWFGEGKNVAIVSGFTNRKPQALKQVGDHWETTLSIAPGTYKFLYVIDGKNTLDPHTDQKDGRSVVVIE